MEVGAGSQDPDEQKADSDVDMWYLCWFRCWDWIQWHARERVIIASKYRALHQIQSTERDHERWVNLLSFNPPLSLLAFLSRNIFHNPALNSFLLNIPYFFSHLPLQPISLSLLEVWWVFCIFNKEMDASSSSSSSSSSSISLSTSGMVECVQQQQQQPQPHVLAVDDNLIDRKIIEKLLRNSSCKGDSWFRLLQFVSDVIFIIHFCCVCELLLTVHKAVACIYWGRGHVEIFIVVSYASLCIADRPFAQNQFWVLKDMPNYAKTGLIRCSFKLKYDCQVWVEIGIMFLQD